MEHGPGKADRLGSSISSSGVFIFRRFVRAMNANEKRLSENAYPGRGIIVGMTPDSKNLVQIYWIMGRSENSRNRIFVREGDNVKRAFMRVKLTTRRFIILLSGSHSRTSTIVSTVTN